MKLLSFVSFPNSTGKLTPIEKDTIPFPIKRVFYLSDVPAGARRGGHAHHEMEEVVIALSGSFDVVTEGRQGRKRWSLNRADVGLYIEPGEWRYLCNFSTGAIALCLASTEFDPGDYINDLYPVHLGWGPGSDPVALLLNGLRALVQQVGPTARAPLLRDRSVGRLYRPEGYVPAGKDHLCTLTNSSRVLLRALRVK